MTWTKQQLQQYLAAAGVREYQLPKANQAVIIGFPKLPWVTFSTLRITKQTIGGKGMYVGEFSND